VARRLDPHGAGAGMARRALGAARAMGGGGDPRVDRSALGVRDVADGGGPARAGSDARSRPAEPPPLGRLGARVTPRPHRVDAGDCSPGEGRSHRLARERDPRRHPARRGLPRRSRRARPREGIMDSRRRSRLCSRSAGQVRERRVARRPRRDDPWGVSEATPLPVERVHPRRRLPRPVAPTASASPPVPHPSRVGGPAARRLGGAHGDPRTPLAGPHRADRPAHLRREHVPPACGGGGPPRSGLFPQHHERGARRRAGAGAALADRDAPRDREPHGVRPRREHGDLGGRRRGRSHDGDPTGGKREHDQHPRGPPRASTDLEHREDPVLDEPRSLRARGRPRNGDSPRGELRAEEDR
jgi:hypothetical protein